MRGATAPSRNNLSHANKTRDASLAEKLFWSLLAHLQNNHSGFAQGRRGRGVTRRFRKVIHVVDCLADTALALGYWKSALVGVFSERGWLPVKPAHC